LLRRAVSVFSQERATAREAEAASRRLIPLLRKQRELKPSNKAAKRLVDALGHLADRLRPEDTEEAVALHQEAVGVVRETFGPASILLGKQLHALGDAQLQGHDPSAAMESLGSARILLQSAMQGARSAHPKVERMVTKMYYRCLSSVVQGHFDLGEMDTALAMVEMALPEFEKHFGRDHIQTLTLRILYYTVMAGVHGGAPALPGLLETHTALQAALGREHTQTVACASAVARTYKELERYEEAEEMLRQIVDTVEARDGAASPSLGTVLTDLADLLRITGKYDDTLELYRRVAAIRDAHFPPGHQLHLQTRDHIAATLLNMGQTEEALAQYEEQLPDYRAAYGRRHPEVARCLTAVAVARRRVGQPEGALAALTEAIDIARERGGTMAKEGLQAMSNMTLVLCDLGRFDEAAAAATRAHNATATALGPEHPQYHRTLRNVALCQEEAGRNDDAIATFERCLTHVAAREPPGHPAVVRLVVDLANRGMVDHSPLTRNLFDQLQEAGVIAADSDSSAEEEEVLVKAAT